MQHLDIIITILKDPAASPNSRNVRIHESCVGGKLIIKGGGGCPSHFLTQQTVFLNLHIKNELSRSWTPHNFCANHVKILTVKLKL